MLAVLICSVLNGCVGMAVGAGATAANTAAQERGPEAAIDDTVIRTRINSLWFDYDEKMYRQLSLQVHEGRALVTGEVDTKKKRVDAVRLAWQAEGVREVINEIQVGDNSDLVSYARDTWISAQLKSAFVFDKDVSSINYSIETVNGVVYIMGIAQSQDELERVTAHARNLEFVRDVISYVRVKSLPRNADRVGASKG